MAHPFRFLRRKGLAAAITTAVCFSGFAGHAALPQPRPQPQSRPASAAVPAAAASLAPNASAITAAYLRDVLFFLSSDEMEGRYTPSRGLDTAALYLASNLAQWGYDGAGDAPAARDPKLGPLAAFLYHFDLQSSQIEPGETWVEVGGHRFGFGAQVEAASTAGNGRGPLLFVGHGYVQKRQQIDPYKGLDVKGKILIVDGEPPELAAYQRALIDYIQASRSGDTHIQRPTNPLGVDGIDYLTPEEYAAAHGALAVITGNLSDEAMAFLRLPKPVRSASPDQLANSYPAPPPNVPPMQVDRFLPPASEQVPSLYALPELWNALQSARQHPSVAASFSVGTRVRRARAEDVVAVLPGSDPVLAKQYLVLSAHLDHLGICPPVSGDDLCNGADDDGSGSTGLLAIAKAFATGPRPKRSVAFIWHSGEEEGLWGSEYFTRFPTIPLDHVVTDLNMDMIGRAKMPGDPNAADRRLTGPNGIFVIGPRVSSSDLEHTLDAVNDSYLKLHLNHYYDRTDDPERIFYRSDHFNYAAQGIPILFFFDGIHVDYHKPGDEPQKIDYQKMEKVARTVYAIAWRLTNQPSVPRLNDHLPVALVQAMAAARHQHRTDATRFPKTGTD